LDILTVGLVYVTLLQSRQITIDWWQILHFCNSELKFTRVKIFIRIYNNFVNKLYSVLEQHVAQCCVVGLSFFWVDKWSQARLWINEEVCSVLCCLSLVEFVTRRYVIQRHCSSCSGLLCFDLCCAKVKDVLFAVADDILCCFWLWYTCWWRISHVRQYICVWIFLQFYFCH